jgi:hypothetical protein
MLAALQRIQDHARTYSAARPMALKGNLILSCFAYPSPLRGDDKKIANNNKMAQNVDIGERRYTYDHQTSPKRHRALRSLGQHL